MNTIKRFIASHPKLVYEVQSFGMTFVGVYLFITGINENTTLRYIIDNKDVLIGSAGIAFSRTVVIYVISLFKVDYRQSTSNYKK